MEQIYQPVGYPENQQDQNLSIGKLAEMRQENGAKIVKSDEAKKSRAKFEVESAEEFKGIYQAKLYSIGELGVSVANAMVDVFGRDVAGIMEERNDNTTTTAALTYKIVFKLSDPKTRGSEYAAVVQKGEDSRANKTNEEARLFSTFNRMNQIRRGNPEAVVDVELTSDAIDFILGNLIDDNECFNDRSNKKFLQRYVTYSRSNVDNKTMITVHGITLEKAAELVFGKATYMVTLGNGYRPQFGNLIMISRAEHKEVNKAIRNYAGTVVSDEGLRIPTNYR